MIEKVTYAAKKIFFETKSDKLSSQSFEALNGVVKILKNNPSIRLQIEGHTDNVGTPAFNLGLSQKRADAVKKYFEDQGIESSRLRATGYGHEKPVADNKTPEGKSKNRRVELIPVQQ